MAALRVVGAARFGRAARAEQQLVGERAALLGLGSGRRGSGRRRRRRRRSGRLGARVLRAEQQRQQGGCGARAGGRRRSAAQRRQRQQQPEREQADADRERDLEALLAAVRELARERLLLHALERRRERREAGVGRRDPVGLSAGPARDDVERRHVEARDDRVAGLVALVAGYLAVGVHLGHRLAGLGADADREHHDARFLRARHRLLHVPGEVLAVGHQHQRLVAPVLVDEAVEPLGEAGAERGAGGRHDPGLDRLEEEAERVGVERQRDERVGFALERHEREAVPREPRDQREQRLAREEEAARRHVGRGHRAGGVEHQHDVLAFALDLLAHDSPLRARQRDDREARAQQQQRYAQRAEPRVGPSHDAAPERTRDEGREPLLVAAAEPRRRYARERQQRETEEPRGCFEDHAGTTRRPDAHSSPAAASSAAAACSTPG